MRSTTIRQRGVALITALLVVAIATIAAVQIATRQHLDIRRAQNILARDQAYSYALGAEAGAMTLLKSDLQLGPYDDLSDREIWHKPVMFDYEGAKLTLQIEDLHGRFDLNTLAGLSQNNPQTNPHYKRFRNLLVNVVAANPDTIDNQIDPDALIAALADWIDSDLLPRGQSGAEDDIYMSLPQPYRAANQPLASPTELMLVRGFTPPLVNALLPFVTALPVPSLPYEGAINVNTAKPEVLRALSERMDQETAEDLAKRAKDQPWQDPNAFLKDPAVSNLGIDSVGLTTKSDYFLAHARVTLDRAVVPLQSVLHRSGGSVRVVSRGRGAP